MSNKYEQAKEILSQHGQEHLLLCYDRLSDADKEILLNQILSIDFNLMDKLYNQAKEGISIQAKKIEPIDYTDKFKLTESEIEKYKKTGEEILRQGKLATVTMAGGQGTRLGHNGPKGTFILDKEKNKSLFEILCDTLKKGNATYGITVPWYIMTSKENNNDTIKFFEENNYFNYPKKEIKFFIQGELPMIDQSGNILLDEKGLVKQAADGHGGIFEAMFKNHIVEDMKQKNIEWIFINGIDNPLAKMVDPVFIGLTVEQSALAAGKSLVKANPGERVGVFCKKDGRPSVVEYTEISKEMSEMIDENRELVYGEAHIIMNMFNIKAIEEIGANKLQYHPAFKKADYMNYQGEMIQATEPNAYKFESFIFDAFERLEKMTIMRVKREEEFAPVKNATGVDSPETAIELYTNYHKGGK